MADRKRAGKKRKNNKRRGMNGLEMFVISLVVIVLLSFMLLKSSSLSAKNKAYEQRIEELDKALENEKERTEEIAELESEVNTKEYAGEVARERLGLLEEDEILFRAEN